MTTRTYNKGSLDRELYRNRINVGMIRAERSSTFQKFERDLTNAFIQQIELVAKPAKIDSIMLFMKGAKPEEQQVMSFLSEKKINVLVEFIDFMVWSGEVGGEAVLGRMDINAVFTLVNPEIIKFFQDREKLLITGIEEYTAKWIAETIRKGKEQNLTVHEIATLLKNNAKGISKIRANRIAITELANAMTTVQLEFARRMGVKRKKWVTSQDEMVCPVCSVLDGKVIDINGRYGALGGKAINHVQGPPAHPNCRCFILEDMDSIVDQPASYWLGA